MLSASAFAWISGVREHRAKNGNGGEVWISSTPMGYAEICVLLRAPLMEAFARAPEIRAKHCERGE